MGNPKVIFASKIAYQLGEIEIVLKAQKVCKALLNRLQLHELFQKEEIPAKLLLPFQC